MLTIPAALALICGAGCSGINTTQSISPASFFLPGLMRADPPVATNTPPAAPDMSNQYAQAR